MGKKYTDRSYKHSIPKSRLQAIYNRIIYTREGGAIAFTFVTMLCFVATPSYCYYKEVGRKEFMRREDRKVASAIASVNLLGDQQHEPE